MVGLKTIMKGIVEACIFFFEGGDGKLRFYVCEGFTVKRLNIIEDVVYVSRAILLVCTAACLDGQ